MIFLPLLFFMPLLIYSLKLYKNDKNPIPLSVIGLYVFGALCTLITKADEWYPYFSESSVKIENFILYVVFLYPFLMCVVFVKPIKENFFENKLLIGNYTYLILGGFGVFSIIYQTPYAIASAALGASQVRDQQNLLSEFILPNSPLTTLATGVSFFYIFFIAAYFISVIQNRPLYIRYLMIFGSLSYIVSGITFATRDVYFNYLFGFIFCYLYFKPSMSIDFIKSVKKVILYIIIFSALIVTLISVDRFSEKSVNDSLAYGTIGYFGQQPYVFSVAIEEHTNFYYGDLRFPVFKSLISGEISDVRRTELYETSFGTFLKDFYGEGGWEFLIVAAILFPAVTCIIYKGKFLNLKFNEFVCGAYIFQFLTSGFFYYSLGSRAGNIYFVIITFACILNSIFRNFSFRK